MNTQDTHAQNPGQTTPQPLTVDFKHRLSAFPQTDGDGLADSIALMTERATGILFLLSAHLEGNSENWHIVGAVHAAIKEVQDIQATVEAYLEAERAQAAGLANPKA